MNAKPNKVILYPIFTKQIRKSIGNDKQSLYASFALSKIALGIY